MADCMNFPKSFNEFIDDYSFNDLDEIYTNGSKLIPTFRVMQGYEHFEKMIRADERAKVIDELLNKWCNETCGVNRCVDHMDRCEFGEFLMKMKGDKA